MTPSPRARGSLLQLRLLSVCLVAILVGFFSPGSASAQVTSPGPVPRAECGPGSNPEIGRQGRVTAEEVANGRAKQGYTCNTRQLSQFGTRGGFKVYRYVDSSGNECAYFDTTLLFPKDAITAGQDQTGVYVLDMKDPSRPVKTQTLITPAMQSPHESLNLNVKRGLLVAVTANPVFYPGFVDVYALEPDCRHPVLKTSSPVGGLGHESGFAPDGKTLYSNSLDGGTITAVDLSNPSVPLPLWTTTAYKPHGLSVSDDGNRVYLANRTGLVILDVSQIQARATLPQHKEISRLTWPTRSTPQMTIPVTMQGRPYLIEMDEFGDGDKIGGARIIDISDEVNPKVVSTIKLEVHLPENQASQVGDPGASFGLQGYAGHYCDVPTRIEPKVLACTFILSGLRFFDISDPLAPKEIAYFNAPVKTDVPGIQGNYAMSSPVIVPERNELWYTDGNSGFYALQLTNSAVLPLGGSTGSGTKKGKAKVQGLGLAATGPGPSPRIGMFLLMASFALCVAARLRFHVRPTSAGQEQD